jgi:hypothetical protein
MFSDPLDAFQQLTLYLRKRTFFGTAANFRSGANRIVSAAQKNYGVFGVESSWSYENAESFNNIAVPIPLEPPLRALEAARSCRQQILRGRRMWLMSRI